MTRAGEARERAASGVLPLFDRYPALARLPRAKLGRFPSPVSRITGLPGGRDIWIKRDDLDAPSYGGNKVRALEFLLGEVRPGDTLLTIGGEGSTHVLVTAAMGERLGARTVAIRWRHDMNPAALRTASRAADLCAHIRTTRSPISAFLASLLARRAGDVRWVPPGGTNALGMLGHVNAGLELAEQVARGELPTPSRVVVPFGTGGTAAGLALGFAIADLPTRVVAARVVPRMVANRRRLLSLTRSCAKLIARLDGRPVPSVDPARMQIVNDVYGGAYGRPLPAASAAAADLRDASGVLLDDSYSAKAFLAALRLPRDEPVLFWLTFAGEGRKEGAGSRQGELRGSRQQKADSSELPGG
ncbi:MAG TPA: pyridoxal-phosphate dependent enzyme [Gemmatimonadaceae bacterium]|nr:pyridoxal-phosphate dependent enzyme [Gemmatimonadaceae bacterium]